HHNAALRALLDTIARFNKAQGRWHRDPPAHSRCSPYTGEQPEAASLASVAVHRAKRSVVADAHDVTLPWLLEFQQGDPGLYVTVAVVQAIWAHLPAFTPAVDECFHRAVVWPIVARARVAASLAFHRYER